MNYENLKDAIVAVIKQNGNEEITGNILQQVLVAMVNSLGSGYQFRGIATPETNPGTPDQRVFYLASATGTYSDFGFIVSDEICALVYDTAWHKQTIIALDQEPTEDSGNLISSGAIYTALQNLADTYMQLVESAEENHLAIFDGDGQVKDAGKGLDELALPAGHYPDLFAGFAGNLVDTRSAGTRQQFAFRQSGGDGVNYMRKILGRTEAWNQLVGPSDTQVTIPSGHLYYAIINGTASVGTSDGMPISVTGGVDIVVDLTLEGLGLTTADQFRALHPLPYYAYNAGVLKNNAATGLETVGFNQWDEESEEGNINSATGANIGSSTSSRSKNYIPVVPSTNYYTNAVIYRYGYDANKNYVWYDNGGANNFSTPANVHYIRFAQSTADLPEHICINLSDASRNGIYEPYWKRDIVLGLNNLACHDEDNNAVVVNGLDGVGTAQDELIVENGWGTKINKEMDEVDLGDLAWSYAGGTFISTSLNAVLKFPTSVNTAANAICDKYGIAISYGEASGNDKVLFTTWVGAGTGVQLCLNDSAYTDAATFKAAMAGVKLRFELATPKVLTLDNPIPALIEVDNLGTGKRLPEDTADTPQGPFESDSNYSISAANLVRKLSEL